MENADLLPPLLQRLSPPSFLLWGNPTSGKPSPRAQFPRPCLRLALFRRACQTSQVCVYYFVRSPRSIDPGGIPPTSLYRLVLVACSEEKHLGFRSLLLTGLNRFTLSHCGSRTPCPTLKPRLTASAPRTRYRLLAKLCRIGTYTQLYYTHRTGALSSLGDHIIYTVHGTVSKNRGIF